MSEADRESRFQIFANDHCLEQSFGIVGLSRRFVSKQVAFRRLEKCEQIALPEQACTFRRDQKTYQFPQRFTFQVLIDDQFVGLELDARN
jgi:hypothetical protein